MVCKFLHVCIKKSLTGDKESGDNVSRLRLIWISRHRWEFLCNVPFLCLAARCEITLRFAVSFFSAPFSLELRLFILNILTIFIFLLSWWPNGLPLLKRSRKPTTSQDRQLECQWLHPSDGTSVFTTSEKSSKRYNSSWDQLYKGLVPDLLCEEFRFWRISWY